MTRTIIVLFILANFLSCSSIRKISNDEKTSANKDLIELKYFGNVNKNEAQSSIYIDDVLINEIKTTMSIDFPTSRISEQTLKTAELILDKIPNLERESMDLIKVKSKNEGRVKDFIQHYVEYLNEEDFEFLGVDFNLPDDKKESGILKNINLRGVAVYPEDKAHTLRFDYALSKNGLAIDNERLVLSYNAKYKLVHITTES